MTDWTNGPHLNGSPTKTPEANIIDISSSTIGKAQQLL